MTRIGVLGLGEAGAAIAADLAAAGVEVHGYDPAVGAGVPAGGGPASGAGATSATGAAPAAGTALRAGTAPATGARHHEGPIEGDDPAATMAGSRAGVPAAVVRHERPESAVAGADVVLAVTPAAHARTALEQVLEALPTHAVYADLSTASPALKRELAALARATGVGFVDVALMSPVPGRGLRTPVLASGTAAEAFATIMRPLGMPVESAGVEAGQAATRKLLRSVVMKGLAQVLVESLEAAEAAGLASETWENLVTQLTSIDEELVRRLVTATAPHALRRLHEMEATVELLTELGVEPVMSRATAARLRHLVDSPSDLPTPPDG